MALDDLIALKNIGPRTAAVLIEAGIETPETLDALGAVEAWKRIRKINPAYNHLMGLYALQGALMDCDIALMPREIIEELKQAAAQVRAAERLRR